MRLSATQRKGAVAVVVAVSLIGILGVIALSLDGGILLDKRRQVQAVADAAAYAGASELFKTTFTNHGYDKDGSIALYVKDVAKANGFEDGKDGVSVQAHIPPQSGPFAGQAGHVEVLISMPQRRYFSRIFGSSVDVPVGARAVARGIRSTINDGIIVLNPTLKGSFQTGGTGSSAIKGGADVIVDSNNTYAMIANGGGSVTAPQFQVTGMPGWETPGGGSFVGTINSNVPPTPDPLRFVPPPDPTTMVVRSTKKLQFSSANTVTLQPGVYIGGISISGKTNIVLEPGIYYMQGGGFNYGGQGSLTGVGVMIYNDPQSNSDAISLSGQGAVTMSPPTSGPYQGISLFQRRSGLPQPDLSVTGAGTAPLSITGTFYAAGALLKVTGNGTQDTIGSQYISDTLTLGGNGTFNVDWNPTDTPGVRQVWLVE